MMTSRLDVAFASIHARFQLPVQLLVTRTLKEHPADVALHRRSHPSHHGTGRAGGGGVVVFVFTTPGTWYWAKNPPRSAARLCTGIRMFFKVAISTFEKIFYSKNKPTHEDRQVWTDCHFSGCGEGIRWHLLAPFWSMRWKSTQLTW